MRPVWRAFETPFIPGRLQPDMPTTGLPLDRFLAPWYEGMASRWMNNYASPGAWVLDPFGQSPFSVLELARAGYRVLVTANNPVAAFIIETLASAPQLKELQAALNCLGDSPSNRGENLREQIQSHYRLTCPNPNCASHLAVRKKPAFEVDRYIWHEDQTQPSSASGHCRECGFEGEIDLNPENTSALPDLPPIGMTRARALQKIATPNDPLREVMEDVIHFYTDRALYLLQLILDRIESTEFTPRQKTLLRALLLSAADRVNQLWAQPLGRNRPRQLSRPPVFQEFNLWQALEAGCKQWASEEKPITLRPWPEKLPQSGGINLFKGRLRELDPAVDDRIEIVYANLPRRNHAWWNLSGLWSGWLWGQDGIKTLRNSLLKQRYDWTWHSTALEKVLVRLNRMVRPSTPVLMQISELDPLFILAGIKAAQNAGFSLRTASCSGNVAVLQSVWKFSPTRLIPTSANAIRKGAREIAERFLNHWGEPASYSRLFTQTILGLQTQGLLFQSNELSETTPINKVQEDLNPVFTDSSLFFRFNPGVSTESGSYWLAHPPTEYTALADRVEHIIRNEFLHTPKRSALEIAIAINTHHPGLMTPDQDLVQNVLKSYASSSPEENHQIWTLNAHEDFATRNHDIQTIREIIESIAHKLNLKRQLSSEAIYFLDDYDHELFTFFITGSAMISDIVQRNSGLSGRKLIVLPGSRANLISYKLRRDPSLQSLLGDDWHFVKFRLLRNLHQNPLLTRELFASQILSDPPEYQASQLALF